MKIIRNRLQVGLQIVMVVTLLAIGTPSRLASANPAIFQYGDVFAGVANGLVYHYDKDGNFLESLDTGAGGFTTGCAFDSSGSLYVTAFYANQVAKFSGPTDPHTQTYFGSGYSTPESIVFDANGNVFVGNLGNGIRQYSADGTFVKTVINTRVDWFDISADQDTILYTEEGNSIKRVSISTGNSLSDFTTGTTTRAFALRILPDGGVLLADNVDVKRFNKDGAIIQTYDVSGEDSWFSLNLDPDGTSFWAGNYLTGKFYKFNIDSGGSPLITVDTGLGNYKLYGLCVFGEITLGSQDSDEDGLPDIWETEGVDLDGNSTPDLDLKTLDEIGDDIPPDPYHKDIYVWVDWLNGGGNHDGHKPDEAALLLVKQAFADAPADAVNNPDKKKGINLHIVMGNAIPETEALQVIGSMDVSIEDWQVKVDSKEFSELKKKYLMADGNLPGRASIFRYVVFGHYLPEIHLPCLLKEPKRPAGLTPMITLSSVGSDFMIGYQTLKDENRLANMVVGGVFMHELGHTLNLGHGGVGIRNSTNFKPNHLSVMNYSFSKGLLIRPEGSDKAQRTTLDYSRFGPETIPSLDERNLVEKGGLHGSSIIDSFGTIYYTGFYDMGVIIDYANGDIDWNNNNNIDSSPVSANINKDHHRLLQDFVCVANLDGKLEISNEWAGLSYKQGSIGTVAALVQDYPIETVIDLDNSDIAETILNVPDTSDHFIYIPITTR